MPLPKGLEDKIMYDSEEDKAKNIHGKVYVVDLEEWLGRKNTENLILKLNVALFKALVELDKEYIEFLNKQNFRMIYFVIGMSLLFLLLIGIGVL